MKLYLIRHGETVWNHLHKMQGQMDIPLNDYGIELAEKTAEGMKEIRFDRIFASPLIRAKKTAEILAERSGIPVETDERLKEISFGIGEGSDVNDARQNPDHPMHNFFGHPERYVPLEGGESLQQLQERGLSFLREVILPLEEEAEQVAIVAHAAIIRSMMLFIKNRQWSEFWDGTYYRNCCVSIVSCEDGKMTALEEAKIYYALSI